RCGPVVPDREGGDVNAASVAAPHAMARASALAGWIVALALVLGYAGMALSVDVPAQAGIYSDEATYYMMGKSLALDGDFTYRHEDIDRVWKEYPSGPAGVFLKQGRHVTGLSLVARPPFVAIDTGPDPDAGRLFFGKSFVYPLFAAPFVRLFGTNGFLVFNSLLLGLSFLTAYTFIGARSGTVSSLLMSTAFVMATVVPVYVVWMMPELFNFTLGLVAYFFWLYKYVAPRPGPSSAAGSTRRSDGWLGGRASDYVAMALLAIATFSKLTNALLAMPIVFWFLWRREWKHAVGVGVVFAGLVVGLFGTNVAITGEWNYQGGARNTFYGKYPLQQANVGFDVGAERGRNSSLTEVIFDRQMFWPNLRANLEYVFVGRYSGLLPYFFPAVAGLLAVLLVGRGRQPWQWFVFTAVVAHILVFIVTQPYTYFGGGGTVGNRYFMGAYGACLFLFPPLRSVLPGLVSLLIGGLFVLPIVIHPFAASIKPGDPAKSGPLRWLPVELTNVNALPINTEASRVRVWYGNSGNGDPGFQVYHLDDNGYLQEADRLSFWVRGESRAEFLIKTDRPYARASFALSAGGAATTVEVTLNGRTRTVRLEPNTSTDVRMPLGPGFLYKVEPDQPPKYVWVASIASSAGFTPPPTAAVVDTRYLGVRVKPTIYP
ncbi:MAG: hypothetical protein ABI652_02075, partial [Acidobacteriota bacterium]